MEPKFLHGHANDFYVMLSYSIKALMKRVHQIVGYVTTSFHNIVSVSLQICLSSQSYKWTEFPSFRDSEKGRFVIWLINVCCFNF